MSSHRASASPREAADPYVVPARSTSSVDLRAGNPPAAVQAEGGRPDYAAIHASPEFTDVRRRLRRFVFTMTVVFLAWYQLFMLLSAFAVDLMSVPVLGVINIGMLLGLSQFATTLIIVAAYRHFARTRIDPRVRAIREAYGGGGRDTEVDPLYHRGQG